MSVHTPENPARTFSRSKIPLMLSVVLAIILAAGLFGLLGGGPVASAHAADVATDTWEPLHGPTTPGGQINALVAQRDFSATANGPAYLPGTAGVSDTLYALVNGGDLFKSTDSAATWTPVLAAKAESVGGLNAVDVAGQTLYVTTNDCVGSMTCIFHSDNGGSTWNHAYTAQNEYLDLLTVAINPVTPTTAYVAGALEDYDRGWNGRVIYATTNGGADWTTVYSTTDNLQFAAMAVNPVTPTIVFAAGSLNDNGAVLRSLDGGVHWTQVLTAADIGAWMPVQNVNSLLIHPLTPTIVYAGTGWGPNVVYRSIDGGDTWHLVNDNPHWGGFRLAYQPPDTIFAMADWGGVSVSTAGGISGTWTSVGDISDPGPVFASGYSALYAGGQQHGIVKSLNGGTHWSPANQGIQSYPRIVNIAADAQDPAGLLAGTNPLGWLSRNGGATWTQPQGEGWPSGPTPLYFAIDPQDDQIVYAGLSSCDHGTVLRSTNGGIDFSPVFTSPVVDACSGSNSFIHAIAVAPPSGATVYAVGNDNPTADSQFTYGVIARSQAHGVAGSWTEVFTATKVDFLAVSIDPVDQAHVYAGGQVCGDSGCPGVLYRTQDAGLTWTLVLTDSQPMRSIVIDPQKPNVLYAASDGYHVYKTTDWGGTWALVRWPSWEPGGGASGNLLAIDPYVPSHVYLAGEGYVGESANGGQTWSEGSDPIGAGLPNRDPAALTVINTAMTQTLYTGFEGVWRYIRTAPQPGLPEKISLGTPVVTPTTSAAITLSVLVLDLNDNWVRDGVPVTFTSSAFTAPGTATTAAGRAQTQVTLDDPARTAFSVTVAVDFSSTVPPITNQFTIDVTDTTEVITPTQNLYLPTVHS